MKHMTALIVFFLASLLSLPANAALIQVEYKIVTNGVSFLPEITTVVMVFDTELPPSPDPGPVLVVTPIAAIFLDSYPNSPSEIPTEIDLNNPPTVDFARLEYDSASNTIALIAYDGEEYGELRMTDVPAAFHPTMMSLSEDPADWLPDQATTLYTAVSTFFHKTVYWTQASGYVRGTFTYTVSTLPSPSTACSPADINGEGQLDFFDVSAFLSIFMQGCP